MFKLDETNYDLFTRNLHNNFRHFSIKFPNNSEAEDAFSVLQTELPDSVVQNNSRIFKLKKLSQVEVLVYFVTRQNDDINWKALLKQILKKNDILFNSIVAIGLSNFGSQ